MRELPYSKACGIEDYRDADLADIIRDIFRHELRAYAPAFPAGAELPRFWESAMAVRALRDHGALTPESTVVVVGAGTEPLAFYLTTRVRRVIAVDRYLTPEAWDSVVPRLMLLRPEELAPYPVDIGRLIVQHMDERELRLPDGSADAVVAMNVVERSEGAGSLEAMAFEAGRVLRPGGVLCLSAKYRIAGPPGQERCDGMFLPTLAGLAGAVDAASGLEPIGEPDGELSAETLQSRRDITRYAAARGEPLRAARLALGGQYDWSGHPFVIHVHRGFVFSSAHLALRKTERYEERLSGAARPGPAVAGAVSRELQRSLRPPAARPPVHTVVSEQKEAAVVMHAHNQRSHDLRQRYYAWEALRLKGWYNTTLRRLPAPVGAAVRTILRIAFLGHVHDAQAALSTALVDAAIEGEARLIHAEARLTEQAGRIGDLQAQMGQRDDDAQLAPIHDELRRLSRSQESQAQEIARQQQEIGRQQQEIGRQLEEIAQQQREIARRQQELGEAQAQGEQIGRTALGQARMALYQLDRARAGDGARPQLGRADALTLMRGLGERVPDIQRCGSVEVSAQGDDTEEFVVALAEQFGERMSSAGATYRHPNDAWLHVDLTDSWDRPDIFENAQSRLRPGGLLVLVTQAGREHAAEHARLEALEPQAIDLDGGRRLQAFVWRRE